MDPEWQKMVSATFQLPHHDHPEEAHTGHVYTIQLNGKWLVSGSADKTIRVWDLETRRLRGTPLIGHSQSVLCLQFDPSEKEDLIISGSVDASIVVWRFSTGQPLRTIPNAHEESILDLRFNQRYLVTGSKDRTVKIWNRHELSPLNQDYPRIKNGPHTSVPSYIVDLSSVEPSLIEAELANGSIQTLEPYTHLATLQAHSAAVNAVDIQEDLLISASGDRAIYVWSVATGQCLRRLDGPERGLACIQSDGKHVVSGSSDNSLRIHNVETGVEMDVLRGHSNVVRSLQVDFEGVLNAALNKSDQARQHFEDGNKWNRIVSGSYDQSIIIWKKDTHGNWSVEHTLRMDDIDASFPNFDSGTRVTSIDSDQRADPEQQDPILRVFKVRFDAKRLACCSQDSRIFCWEFARQ